MMVIVKGFYNKKILIKVPKSSGCETWIASYHGAFHPVTGKKPPTLEEFDPLNPGEWQLGAAGKILPRLPEGTRCGKLVMGKYGLYDPKIRKLQQDFWEGTHHGTTSSSEARPFDVLCSKMIWVISFIAFVGTCHNLAMMQWASEDGPYWWPYSMWNKKKE